MISALKAFKERQESCSKGKAIITSFRGEYQGVQSWKSTGRGKEDDETKNHILKKAEQCNDLYRGGEKGDARRTKD